MKRGPLPPHPERNEASVCSEPPYGELDKHYSRITPEGGRYCDFPGMGHGYLSPGVAHGQPIPGVAHGSLRRNGFQLAGRIVKWIVHG